MNKNRQPLPNPSAKAVATWLQTTPLDDVHAAGWQRMNREFHGITMAVRPYITQQFNTAAEQRAAFDGLTLALLAMTRFADIEQLAHALDTAAADTPRISKKLLPPPAG